MPTPQGNSPLQIADIILAAEQNVSRGTELDSIAYQKLNLLLSQLYLDYTWPFLSKQPPATVTLTSGSTTWTAPSDYLKFNTMVCIRTDINPTNPPHIVLHKIDMEQYFMLRTPGTTGPPQAVAINSVFTLSGSPNVTGYIYPTPDKDYTCQLLYYFNPAYDIGDTGVPDFPDQNTLVILLTNELYGYVKDPRYNEGLLEAVVARYRRNMVDTGQYPQVARLDARRHRPRQARFNIWPQDTGNPGPGP